MGVVRSYLFTVAAAGTLPGPEPDALGGSRRWKRSTLIG